VVPAVVFAKSLCGVMVFHVLCGGLLSPQCNQNYENQDRQCAPNHHYFLESDFANGRNVFAYVWIFIEKPVAIANDVKAAE
jgi:hypothetical protein